MLPYTRRSAVDNKKMRLGLYRKIEIARDQLPDMDEESFRQRLETSFGVRSRTKLSIHQLSQLVHDFAVKDGVVYTSPAKAHNRTVKPHSRPDWVEITDSMSLAREKREILAIWRKLGYSMSSLDTRVKRAFGVPVFVWMQNGEQISTLLSDLQRRERAFERASAVRAQQVTDEDSMRNDLASPLQSLSPSVSPSGNGCRKQRAERRDS